MPCAFQQFDRQIRLDLLTLRFVQHRLMQMVMVSLTCTVRSKVLANTMTLDVFAEFVAALRDGTLTTPTVVTDTSGLTPRAFSGETNPHVDYRDADMNATRLRERHKSMSEGNNQSADLRSSCGSIALDTLPHIGQLNNTLVQNNNTASPNSARGYGHNSAVTQQNNKQLKNAQGEWFGRERSSTVVEPSILRKSSSFNSVTGFNSRQASASNVTTSRKTGNAQVVARGRLLCMRILFV